MPAFGTRTHVTRNGTSLSYSELGFGTAPIGNLYRAVSDLDAAAALDAAWGGGLPVL